MLNNEIGLVFMSCINKDEDEPLVQATSNKEFLESLQKTWQRSYLESAFLKDIPRLVKRVRVQTKDGVLHGPAAEETSKVEAIVSLVELISRELGLVEDEQAIAGIRNSLDSGLLQDMSEEQAVAYVFQGLQADGAIIKVLKLVNQGTVLYAMSVLKEEVLKDILTKDVRTAEGWQIVLRLGDVIQLEHIRTEQSMDEFGDQTNHFEVQWMVMVTFDSALEQLRACSVRLLRMLPATSMQPDRLRYLRNTLIEGLIIL